MVPEETKNEAPTSVDSTESQAAVTPTPAPAEATAPPEAAASVEAAADSAAPDDAVAPSGDDAAAPSEDGGDAVAAQDGDASVEGEKKKKKRRRKKKKSGDGAHHHAAPFHVGEETFGKVTAVLETAIMVDLSGKALAVFDRGEMEPDDLVPEVDERFVGKVLFDGGRGGLVVLTRKPLRDEEAKPKIELAQKDGALVFGLVTGVIKGGVEVLLDGLRAFAPASGMDLHPRTANFQNLVGQRLDFKVTSYEKQGKDIVVTRRPMLEKEAHERRVKARELLTDGAEMQGIVRTVVEWGAFVALPEAEYIEGLVHISELSHNPRDRVSDVLKPGQKLKVLLQKIDDKGKIWLSRKALIEDPFQTLTAGIKLGEVVEGEVMRVEDFGAFIKLDGGFEGLCHVADMGAVRVEDARKVMQPGEKVRVLVHHIDSGQRRVALHPAPSEEHAAEERQKVIKGQKIKAEVVKIEGAGLTVRILGATGRQARGFVPAGQTGTQRGDELKKHFTVGAILEVLVFDIDPKRREPKLSISRLAQDEERRAHKEYQKKVKEESKFGTFADLLKAKLEG